MHHTPTCAKLALAQQCAPTRSPLPLHEVRELQQQRHDELNRHKSGFIDVLLVAGGVVRASKNDASEQGLGPASQLAEMPIVSGRRDDGLTEVREATVAASADAARASRIACRSRLAPASSSAARASAARSRREPSSSARHRSSASPAAAAASAAAARASSARRAAAVARSHSICPARTTLAPSGARSSPLCAAAPSLSSSPTAHSADSHCAPDLTL